MQHTANTVIYSYDFFKLLAYYYCISTFTDTKPDLTLNLFDKLSFVWTQLIMDNELYDSWHFSMQKNA